MKYNKIVKKDDIKNKNTFLVACVCSILLLLTMCYFGVNGAVKGTLAAKVCPAGYPNLSGNKCYKEVAAESSVSYSATGSCTCKGDISNVTGSCSCTNSGGQYIGGTCTSSGGCTCPSGYPTVSSNYCKTTPNTWNGTCSVSGSSPKCLCNGGSETSNSCNAVPAVKYSCSEGTLVGDKCRIYVDALESEEKHCYYVPSSNTYVWSNSPIEGGNVVSDSNCDDSNNGNSQEKKCYYVSSSGEYVWSTPIEGEKEVPDNNCRKCYYVSSSNLYMWSYSSIEGGKVVPDNNCEDTPENPGVGPENPGGNGGGGSGTSTTKTFTATFNPNGGVLNGKSTKSCTPSGTSCYISDLPTASKEGNTFNGWGTSSSCTSGSKSTLTLDSHTTFYACYSNNSGNNGNVTENPTTGEITIALVWFAGLFAIAYSVYYFKQVKQN